MRTVLSRNATTVVIAMVTAAVTAGGPAVAAAVADAVNADTVDHRHAVGAGATREQRAGKLVATDTAGRLPDNIIERAPDADLLDGRSSASYWRKAERVNAAKLNGRAAHGLTRVASEGAVDFAPLTHGDNPYGAPIEIVAPSAGYVLVTATVSVLEGSSCTSNCQVGGFIRHLDTGMESTPAYASFAEGTESVTSTRVFEVTKGFNTFQTYAYINDFSDGSVSGYTYNISGVFSPFNGSGGHP